MTLSIEPEIQPMIRRNCVTFVFSQLFFFLAFGQVFAQPNAALKPETSIHLDTLDNGLRVIAIEDYESPRVYWSIQFEAPLKLEGNRAGVAFLTGEVMRSGTESMNHQALDALLNQYDAQLHTASGHIQASSPKEFAQETLNLLSQVLRAPSFENEAVLRAIEQHRDRIKSEGQDLIVRAQELGRQQIFTKKHPFGESITAASLDSISKADLSEHHADWYRPQYAALAVQGPLSPEESNRWIREAFGDWTPREIPRTRHGVPNRIERNRVCFTEVANHDLMALTLAHVVRLKPGHKDEAASVVLNSLLTNPNLPGVLVDPQCVSQECLHNASSILRTDRIIGHFEMSALAEPKDLTMFAERCLQSMRDLTIAQVDDLIIEKAIEKVVGEMAIGLQDPQINSDAWLHSILNRQDTAGPLALISAIQEVTPFDVQRVAINYLRPSNLVLAIAGDPAFIPNDLISLNSGEEIAFYDHFGSRILQLDPAPEGVYAETVFENYYDACGGGERFDELHSLIRKGQMKASTGMELDVEILAQYGKGYVMQVSKNGQLMLEQFVTPSGGKNQQMGKSTPMGDQEYQRLRSNLYAAHFLHLTEQGLTAQLLGLDRDPNGPHFVVEVQSDGFPKETLYFNSQTHLLVKTSSNREGPTGPVQLTTVYSDYKVAKGMMFPMTLIQTTNGQSMTFRLNEAIPNGNIPSTLFDLN